MSSLTETQKEKLKQLKAVSNPKKAQLNFKFYQQFNGADPKIKLMPSTRYDKKYMTRDPITNKLVHFGSIDYEDFLKHNDESRRKDYIKRFQKLLNSGHPSLLNPYSPYNLSLNILWM
jgi:hypothetical protein